MERRLGLIDAIGNNSGIMLIVPMAALQVEQRDRMIDAKWSGGANQIRSFIQREDNLMPISGTPYREPRFVTVN